MKPLLYLAACIALATAAFAFDPDVIIDANDNPTQVELSPPGSWGNETTVTNAFRGASRVASNSTASYFARFHTRLPRTGAYSVFVWHNGGSYFGYNYTVQVTHEDETAATVSLNQSSNAGQWLLLGTFWFEGDDDGGPDGDPETDPCKEAEVKLIGGSNMKLSADAVRFMPATADLALDSDAGGAAFSGTWSSVADKAGNAGNVRRASTASQTATATYTFTVPVSGDYDVSLWLPGNAGAWLAATPANLTAATEFSVEIQHPTTVNPPPAGTTLTA